MLDVKQVVEKMIEEPWNADDLVEPLSKADRAAVRTALLAKTADGEALKCLGQFPDAEVIATLQKVLANKNVDEDVHEGAVEALGEMETPAAKKVLRELIDHDVDVVAKIAIENIDGKPAELVKLLLPLVDATAKRGDDLLMLAVVERLVEAAPTNKDVLAALARHWDFTQKHGTTAMASNKIFDSLIEHAPDSPVAQGMFEAALASGHEYGVVRGRAALALTGRDTATHVKELKKLKGLKPSSGAFRSAALKKLGKK